MIRFMIVLGMLLLTGCSGPTDSAGREMTREATLIWQGDYAVDGCGFFVQMDGQTYKPKNEDAIPAEYKSQSETSVRIHFEYLQKDIDYACGFSGIQKVKGIKILSISRN